MVLRIWVVITHNGVMPVEVNCECPSLPQNLKEVPAVTARLDLRESMPFDVARISSANASIT